MTRARRSLSFQIQCERSICAAARRWARSDYRQGGDAIVVDFPARDPATGLSLFSGAPLLDSLSRVSEPEQNKAQSSKPDALAFGSAAAAACNHSGQVGYTQSYCAGDSKRQPEVHAVRFSKTQTKELQQSDKNKEGPLHTLHYRAGQTVVQACRALQITGDVASDPE